MNIFARSHPRTCVGPYDVVHAFYKLLWKSEKVTSTRMEAYAFLVDTFTRVYDDAQVHNYKMNRFSSDLPTMAIDSFFDFKFLHIGPLDAELEKAKIWYTATTKQYLMISDSGAIEVHQMTDSHYLKISYLLYWNNKYKTLIIRLLGQDGKNVWGYSSKKKERFSKKQKKILLK